MVSHDEEGALCSYRVLDLTDENGLFCGKILGDLGADVIVIEKPGGNPARKIGPFYHDMPDPERSLFWFALNTNKRGVTLDVETADGQDILRKLVRTADVVVESLPPGYMESMGLGYTSLTQVNPEIVMTSITAFGPDGPYRDYRSTDLILMALGGLTYLSGDPGRAPVRISVPQSYFLTGAQAAVATLIALWHREMTGEGQHVDVSMQECATWASFYSPEFWNLTGTIVKRGGRWRSFGAAKQQQLFPCKDGYVSAWIMAGTIGAAANKAFTLWLDEEGMCPDWLRDFDWLAWNSADVTQEESDRMTSPFAKFFLTKTKSELFQAALRLCFPLAPVSTPEDILNNPQLKKREFFVPVQHPELGAAFDYPGPMLVASEMPLSIRRRAPLIGEHNLEIYEGELGLSREQLRILAGAAVI